jgi:hypothetical protein
MAEVSNSLTDFQKLLLDQQSFIQQKRQLIMDIQNSGKKEEEKQALIDQVVKDIYKNYTSLFDKYFNNTGRAGQVDWINGIVNKIFSFAGNQKYIRKTYPIKTESKESKEFMAEVINSGVFSHIGQTKSFTGKSFDYIKSASETFTIDFTNIKKAKGSLIQDVFSSFYPSVNKFTDELESVSFKVLLSDGEGRLFKLNKIDNKPISEAIARSSVSGFGKIPNTGLTAEYVKLNIEGTNNLLNFGFSPKDGVKLYEKVRPSDDINDLLNAGVDPSVLSQLSDNKTKQEAPSKYADVVGPVNTAGQQVLDDDAAIAAMIASGQLKGGKVAKDSGAQQAPDQIGFKTIGQPKVETTSTDITLKEIDDIYNQKSVKKITLQEFRKEAQEYIKATTAVGMSKSAILEQLKCL